MAVELLVALEWTFFSGLLLNLNFSICLVFPRLVICVIGPCLWSFHFFEFETVFFRLLPLLAVVIVAISISGRVLNVCNMAFQIRSLFFTSFLLATIWPNKHCSPYTISSLMGDEVAAEEKRGYKLNWTLLDWYVDHVNVLIFIS